MMVNISSIIITIIVSLIYLIILPIQLILFPMQYYSVKDVIYSGNTKKATNALVTRFLYIFIICLISWLINKESKAAIWGISIGSFLCAWPSIYHYQLFAFFKNKTKFLYFIACVGSILFSWACAQFIMKIILPMIFDNKEFYLIDNSGIQTMLTIIGMGGPWGVRKIIKEDEQDNPYLVADTYPADLYLTRRKIQFMKDYVDQYIYEIDKSADKYGIDYDLLRTVVELEIINRGSMLHRLFEKIAVHYLPGLVIRLDASIGLSQIKVSAAGGYFHTAPHMYLIEMLKPETSIDLCAYMLRDILDQYEFYDPRDDYESFIELYDDDNISINFKLSAYIASEYVCGSRNVLKKYILVYATIIHDTCPAIRV